TSAAQVGKVSTALSLRKPDYRSDRRTRSAGRLTERPPAPSRRRPLRATLRHDRYGPALARASSGHPPTNCPGRPLFVRDKRTGRTLMCHLYRVRARETLSCLPKSTPPQLFRKTRHTRTLHRQTSSPWSRKKIP